MITNVQANSEFV